MAVLQSANIVLLSPQLNVAAIQQVWLLENRILQREDFGPETFFTPVAVSVKSPRVELLVVPDRIQVAVPPSDQQGGRTVADVVNALVSNLPGVRFLAAGINFVYWHDVQNIAATTRTLWLSDANPWAEHFGVNDAQFGFYASRDELGCRMKVDAKPARKPDGATGLAFQFNFHKDLSPPPAGINEIRDVVGLWDRAFAVANELVAAIERTATHV